MKKHRILSVLLALMMGLSLCACGGDDAASSPDQSETPSQSAEPSTSPSPSEEPVESSDSGPQVESIDLETDAGRLVYSSYEFVGEGFYNEYVSGDPSKTVILNFDYTNKETKPARTQDHFYITVYQNGTELQLPESWSQSPESLDNFFTTSMKDNTLPVGYPCVLQDYSPVTIMVEDREDSDNYQMMEVEISADRAAPEGTQGSAPEAEPRPDLVLGQTYSTSDWEVTINNLYFTKKCSVSTGAHSSTVKEATEGNVLLVIDSSIKNLTTEALDNWGTEFYTAYALYDGKYKYEDDFFVGEDEIAPLATKTQCLPLEMPADLENASESLVVFITVGGQEYQYVVRGDGASAGETVDAATIDTALQGTWVIASDTTGSFDFNAGAMVVNSNGAVMSGTYTVDTEKSEITGSLTATNGTATVHIPYQYANGTLSLYNSDGQAFVKQ